MAKIGGVLTPKKTKKKQKKPKKTKPIYQFWCSDWFFLVFLGFFGFFLVFFGFFLFFFGIFWDDILTLNLNTKKNQKIPKKTKKNQKKPTEPKKPDSNFECWPRPMPKKTKKSQKKPKKNKKNQFPISNSGLNQCQKKPKKNQKKPMPIWKFKKPKKTKKNQKKPMPIYRFWCSDWFFFGFFWVSTPPKFQRTVIKWSKWSFFRASWSVPCRPKLASFTLTCSLYVQVCGTVQRLR